METEQEKTETKNKKRTKLKLILIVIGVFLMFGCASFAVTSMYIKSKLNKINHVSIPKDNKSLGITPTSNTEINKSEDFITNILLLGTDSRDTKKDSGNSDCIMIITVDKKNNKLKLTSLMRDSIVNVEGYGLRKLTESHNLGGALLTLKTINQNYNLNIKDYVQVDFVGLSKIIDYLGGVRAYLTDDEVTMKDFAINFYIREISNIENITPQYITEPGIQNLNGIQAVAYSRIRYFGNGDFQRTERQRIILSGILKKLSTTNITAIGGAVDQITPYVETNLKTDTIMSMATYILSHKITNFDQTRVPYDEMYRDEEINGEDGLSWDKTETINRLHKFIFGTN